MMLEKDSASHTLNGSNEEEDFFEFWTGRDLEGFGPLMSGADSGPATESVTEDSSGLSTPYEWRSPGQLTEEICEWANGNCFVVRSCTGFHTPQLHGPGASNRGGPLEWHINSLLRRLSELSQQQLDDGVCLYPICRECSFELDQ